MADPTAAGGPVRSTVRIVNSQGLHARPISSFVQTCQGFDARVQVQGPGGEADGGSVLQMMGLGAPQGSELTIEAVGPQAREVVAALETLVSGGFGET